VRPQRPRAPAVLKADVAVNNAPRRELGTGQTVLQATFI
jgi:hypothetical protein